MYMKKSRVVRLGQGRRGMECLKRSSGIDRHTRSKEESAVLQCCNSQMVRFVRAADLRAESDNVRRKENRTEQDCGLPVSVILIFEQGSSG